MTEKRFLEIIEAFAATILPDASGKRVLLETEMDEEFGQISWTQSPGLVILKEDGKGKGDAYQNRYEQKLVIWALQKVDDSQNRRMHVEVSDACETALLKLRSLFVKHYEDEQQSLIPSFFQELQYLDFGEWSLEKIGPAYDNMFGWEFSIVMDENLPLLGVEANTGANVGGIFIEGDGSDGTPPDQGNFNTWSVSEFNELISENSIIVLLNPFPEPFTLSTDRSHDLQMTLETGYSMQQLTFNDLNSQYALNVTTDPSGLCDFSALSPGIYDFALIIVAVHPSYVSERIVIIDQVTIS